MINKTLKDFRNAIHKDLKVEPQNKQSNCFIINENKEQSTIKEIQLTFKNQDDVLIIKQDNRDDLKKNYTIANLFQNNSPNTNKSCDFIVFLNSKDNGLETFYCEIKSSICENSQKDAILQIESSQLFVLFLLEYYKLRYLNNDLEYSQIPRKNLYIYPKLGIPQKNKTYANKKEQSLYFKAIDCIDGCAKISDGYEFFRI